MRLTDDEQRVKEYLKGESKKRTVICLDSTESTNKIAREFLVFGEASGEKYEKQAPPLIIAHEQTAGEGRLGRSYYCERDKGLYMTAVFPLTGNEEYLSLLTLLAGISCVQAIEETARSAGHRINLTLKWPNDIYSEGRKMGGIIVKMLNHPNTAAMIGIGINLNHRAGDFPQEIEDRAVSLKMEGAENVSPLRLAAEIINLLDEKVYINNFLSAPNDELIKELNEKSYTVGKRVSFNSEGRQLLGIAEEILNTGALSVRSDDGRLHTVISGEAGFVL